MKVNPNQTSITETPEYYFDRLKSFSAELKKPPYGWKYGLCYQHMVETNIISKLEIENFETKRRAVIEWCELYLKTITL